MCMRSKCKKTFYDKHRNVIFIKDKWYIQDIDPIMHGDGDLIYYSFVSEQNNPPWFIVYKHEFKEYFYSKQELRKQVINELLNENK